MPDLTSKNEPQNNHTCISLIHLNARSLLPKMTELRHIALQRRPDIIAVSETWLSPLVPSGAPTTVFVLDQIDHLAAVEVVPFSM